MFHFLRCNYSNKIRENEIVSIMTRRHLKIALSSFETSYMFQSSFQIIKRISSEYQYKITSISENFGLSNIIYSRAVVVSSPQKHVLFARFKVLTTVLTRVRVFWDISPCLLVLGSFKKSVALYSLYGAKFQET